MWAVVYVRGKNAKKFRKNTEYGSARWGTPEDIEPYMDPDFRNNIILTQTERLTMNSRPKDPKTARNKNVLVMRRVACPMSWTNPGCPSVCNRRTARNADEKQAKTPSKTVSTAR